MKSMKNLAAATLLVGAAFATSASADLVPGGPTTGKALAGDCYAELDVTDLGGATLTLDSKGKPTITCVDGDPCDQGDPGDGRCLINLGTCINQSNVEGCTPPASLQSLKASAKAKGVKGKIVIEAPQLLDGSGCGAFVDIEIPLKKNGSPGSATVNLKAKAVKGTKPGKDSDKVKFVCNPGEAVTLCPDNPAGGPDKLKMTIAQEGNDLDNGWTGISQNFAVTPNGSLNVCLSECDTTSDTECTANGPVGAGSINGPTFGAPLPLLASNVPVCVVNRFDQPITGTVNYATGDISIHVTLLSDVYFTDRSEVCPRCANNRCSSGDRQGEACTVDATLVVAEGIGNKTYNLSEDCPPLGQPVGILNINFDPLTSGTTNALTGDNPCPRPAGTPPGVPYQDDDCGGGVCGTECTGNACASQVPDPVNPAETVCRDNKGGISQNCCSGDTTRPCFPIADGGSIVRTGRAEAPAPVFPDTTFPKTGTGVLASTFCEAATGNDNVNSTTGLPGPAALLLSGTQEWTQEEAPPAE